MALRPIVPPQHLHPRMLIAQNRARILRFLLAPQPRALPPHQIQMSLLPVELEHVRARQTELAPTTPEARGGLVAQFVTPLLGCHVAGFVPGAADGAFPVDAAGAGQAVAGAGREAGGVGVLVGEAEVVEDEGGVLVEVVVFELEVVGFAVLLGDGCGDVAEAEGAEEVVAQVKCDVAGGETLDFAGFDLGGCDGGEGWGEES